MCCERLPSGDGSIAANLKAVAVGVGPEGERVQGVFASQQWFFTVWLRRALVIVDCPAPAILITDTAG